MKPQTHGAIVPVMSTRAHKTPKAEQLRKAADEVGGELLDGSGFESEKPDEGFTSAVHLPSTFLRNKFEQ